MTSEVQSVTDLCINTAFYGPAVDGDVFLLVLQPVTLGDPDHLLHQVQTRDALSNRMLHLRLKIKQRKYQDNRIVVGKHSF